MSKGILLYTLTASLLLSFILSSIFIDYYNFIRVGACATWAFSIFLFVFCFSKINKWSQITSFKISLKRIDIIIGVLFLIFFIRYLFSGDFNLAADKIVLYTIYFSSYVFIRQLIEEEQDKRINGVLYIIIAFGVFQSIYALLQLFSLLPNLFNYHIGGSFGNPGDLANFLIIPFTICLSLLYVRTNKRDRLIFGIIAILILTVLIISKARTSWVAIIVVTLYLSQTYIRKIFSLLKNRLGKKGLYGGTIVLLAIALFIAINLYKMKQGSSEGRIFIWKQCIELIKEKPLWGHGYDSFPAVYAKKQAEYFKINQHDEKHGMLADDIFFAYNDYLQIGVEYGLGGLLTLLLLFYFALFHNRESQQDCKHKSVDASILGIMVCMFFSYPLQNTSILFILFLLFALKANSVIAKIPIKKRELKGFIIVLFFIGVFLQGTSVFYFVNSLTWKKAYEKYTSNGRNYMKDYDKIFPVLKYDKMFLYNYGSMLFLTGNYKGCISHFERYKNYCFYTEMLMKLAEAYQQTGNFIKAEETYQIASNIKPHLFMPKYRLFQIYKETGRTDMAYGMAKEIKGMKVKVFSQIIQEIKTEIRKYLAFDYPKTLDAS